MARLARAEVFSPDEIAIVHVMNRTVRRCFLLGDDPVTGKNYDHRKNWIENELVHLAKYFGIDLIGHAILSNHYHLVLRSRPDIVATWTDEEIAQRWLMLCPKRRERDGAPAKPNNAELQAILADPGRVQELRSRLSDISWWMRLLSQKIGIRANREDQETGKFWQARYRAVRLLDETAILACTVYVDLNLVRAAIAETIEKSDFTSAQQRSLMLKKQSNEVARGRTMPVVSTSKTTEHIATSAGPGELLDPPNSSTSTIRPIALALCPVALHAEHSGVGPCIHKDGHRASDKGFLSMNTAQYLQLLDWTARLWRSDKRGATPSDAPPLFERLGIQPEIWAELTKDFGKLFSVVAGQPTVVDTTRGRKRGHRYNLPTKTRKLLES